MSNSIQVVYVCVCTYVHLHVYCNFESLLDSYVANDTNITVPFQELSMQMAAHQQH